MSQHGGPHARHVTDLRRRNTLTCLEVLRDSGTITLTELARATGLSRPTVESIVTELVERGLVREHAGADDTTRAVGRPARQYAFETERHFAASLDIGVHTLTGMICDLTGRVRAVVHHDVSSTIDGAGRLKAGLAVRQELLDAVGATDRRLAALVVAVPGIVDGENVVLSIPIPDWSGARLASRFARGTEYPVIIENDINMAALAEHRLGAGQLADDVVLIQAGHRIGAALVLNGELYRGRHFSAGEVGDLAWTGWNGWSDGRLQKEIDLVGGAEAVVRRAREGDTEAIATMHAYAVRIAPGIAALSLIIDPDRVIIGGGLSRAGDLVTEPLHAEIERIAHPRTVAPVVGSRFGSDGAALGALVRALQAGSEHVFGSPDVSIPVVQPLDADHPESDDAADDRRHHSEAAEAGAPVATAHPPAGPGGARALRIGVVGVGARSRLARQVAAATVDARIVAAADPDPTAAARATDLFGDVTFTASHGDLLDAGLDLDAAFVTSPDDTHADIAVDLLHAGVAVYLEKPLATTVADCDRILDAAASTGTKLYVGHNMRHMAVVTTMRDIIARGDIGEVKAVWCRHFVGHGGDYYFKDWHADRSRSTGLLLQKATHDLDVIHWLAGSTTRDVVAMGDLQVYGQITDRADRSGQLMTDWFSTENWPPLAQTGLNPVIDVEDTSMVLMRLESGVLASYQQCHFTPDYWRNYTVIGTEGRLENVGDGDGGTVRVWDRRTAFAEYGHHEYPIVGDSGGHDDADRLAVEEFLRFLAHDEPTATSPIAARDAVATGIAATESLRSGSQPVRVSPADPALATRLPGVAR